MRDRGQGVLWGIMVLGVYITYKLLDIADLTVDGSFALGGCVCAMLILNKSMNPVAVFLRNPVAALAAVSYTHLDVYKRQRRSRAFILPSWLASSSPF